MYRVLYRKWRPEKFSDVIGQQHVTNTLRNEIRLGRISHAYLFTGSRGTGKTSCAKILSRAVNCLSPEDGEPCGKCKNCLGIANGSILDVVEMDAASNNSVNNIRSVLDEVVFTPSDAKYRVYIIDEVHMLSSGAFNALLKTLEEPPSHVVFILATTEINKIPATILSRCQRFDFCRIDVHDIAQRLTQIAGEEGVILDRDASLLIAAVADGAMRDALSILDRCIGLSDNITSDIVREATGLAGRGYLFSLADAVIRSDVPLAINTIHSLHKASKSMSLLCEELAEHFRALMLLKTMKRAAENLIIMTADELEKAQAQSEQISLPQVVSAIETLQSSRELMARGGNNKIEFETCMIRLCSPRLSSDPTAILARLERLERVYAAGSTAGIPTVQRVEKAEPGAAVPKAQPIPDREPDTGSRTPVLPDDEPQFLKEAAAPEPVSAPPSPPKDGNAGELLKSMNPEQRITWLSDHAAPMQEWEDILEELKTLTRVTATAFKGTTAYRYEKFVLIYSQSDVVTNYLKNQTYRDKIKKAVWNVIRIDCTLGPYRPSGSEKKTVKPVKTKLDELIENLSNSDIKVTVVD